MQFIKMIVAPIFAFLVTTTFALDIIANASHITLTAIVTTPKNVSALQCWTLNAPFLLGPDPFLALNVGQFENVTFRVFPPHSTTGVHNAPRHQMNLILSGIVQIALPNDDGKGVDLENAIYSAAGNGNAFLALDLTGRGHKTTQVSDDEGLVLELPFKGGVIPDHTVVNSTGPCNGKESFL